MDESRFKEELFAIQKALDRYAAEHETLVGNPESIRLADIHGEYCECHSKDSGTCTCCWRIITLSQLQYLNSALVLGEQERKSRDTGKAHQIHIRTAQIKNFQLLGSYLDTKSKLQGQYDNYGATLEAMLSSRCKPGSVPFTLLGPEGIFSLTLSRWKSLARTLMDLVEESLSFLQQEAARSLGTAREACLPSL